MSKINHPMPSRPDEDDHGSVGSYAAGFVLSLGLTLVPYYLVVTKAVTGDRLLATIVGYAIFQMLIQILFFLHLGRGPKPLYNIAFFGATVGMILVVVGGSLFIMTHLQHYMTAAEVTQNLTQSEGISRVEGNQTGACQEVYANHQVTISNGQISPAQTTARLCDTITFNNQDSTQRTILFGTYPASQSYGGTGGLPLSKGQPSTITLNQAGTYRFYDDLHPSVNGEFTVGQ